MHLLPEGSAQTKTILVVDDDADSRMICDIILARHGYRVLTCTDGESGLHTAEREQPAAIILDVALPGVDGWKVAELLKENPRTARIPVILYSAHALDSHFLRGRQLGCAGYLVKPCSPRATVAAVQRCLAAEPGQEALLPRLGLPAPIV